MKKFLIASALCAFPFLAAAQTTQEEEDKGYLVGLIEDNLSGASRQVNIVGFKGALSSEASLDVLTVADEDGVWLTLEDVVLDWNRSALLRGQIDVTELSAAKIIVARAPIVEDSGPSPEAQPFSLPELPVGISLDTLQIDRIELGESFLGEAIAVSLTGSASLSGGEGTANIAATRLDGEVGEFVIDGNYSNATSVLGLNMNLREGPDGIIARLLELPGRPSVDLIVAGTAPIADYAADIALATDGQDRVTGTFGLNTTEGTTRFALNVGGDVTPLFAPEYQEFFGPDVALIAEGQRQPDGQIDLSNLDLSTKSLRLQGVANIGAQGWPERVNLTGTIADAEGETVLLPLSGPKTFVDRVSLQVGYDGSVSEDWSGEFTIAGFDRPGLYITDVTLSGGGILRSGEGDAVGEVTADFLYVAKGIELDDTGTAEALGDEIKGEIDLARVEGDPLRISRLTMNGPGIEALGEATIQSPSEGFQTQSTLLLTVKALERFSGLAGRPLAGAGELAIESTVTPLDGLFDVLMTGTTTDLVVGIDQLDPLLRGEGNIAVAAVRDTAGTRIEALTLESQALRLTAQADITSNNSDAEFELALTDIGLSIPELSGPASVVGNAQMMGDGRVDFNVAATGPAANLTAKGTATPVGDGRSIDAEIVADVTDLSRYARLADMPLAGAIRAELAGAVLTEGYRFNGDLSATTRDLAVGIAQLDPLLVGDGTLSARFARPDVDSLQLSSLRVSTPALDLTAMGDLAQDGAATAEFDVTINDAGSVAAGLSGPVRATGTANRDATGKGRIDVDASGPGATAALNADIAAQTNEITGDLTARVNDLRAYRALAGMPISGGINVDISGSLLPDLSKYSADIDVETQDIGIGNATVDQLLRGSGILRGQVAQTANGLQVQNLVAQTPNVTINGSLDGAAGAGRGQFDARLRDVGLFTDQLSGPVTATGTASLDANGNWGVNATGTGPGGITARADGQIGQNGNLDLDVSGQVPLGLANAAIEPRRLRGDANFDLSVNGPPALSSVSGRIGIDGARLAAPTFGMALSDIAGGVTLNGAAAQVNISGNVESGGSVTINGPVALTGGYNADITARLNDVTLRDPELYETNVSGQIGLNGPLQGGARVSGVLTLGTTEVRVPSSGIGSLGDLPEVRHIGADAGVRQTLNRAGVTLAGRDVDAGTQSGGGGASFPLDITINAPSRIFVRGRGVDAELGGTLNLGGTTDNIVPIGQFELVRGRINILQQRFELTEGRATLQGDFVPYIRLVARTEADTGTVIDIIVEGPANEPEVTFDSSPDLPQDEVLSQLIFGRDLASISPLQAVQLAAAVGELAGRGSGGLIDSFRQGIGLDDLDVTTDEEGNAAVRAGKYLSENVYTDVTVTSDGSTEINLNLDITEDITAKGTVDADGETSIGIFYERDY